MTGSPGMLRRTWPDVGGFSYEFVDRRFGRGIIQVHDGQVTVFAIGRGRRPRAARIGADGPTLDDVAGLHADLFEFAAAELARLIESLGLRQTSDVDASWKALARLLELILIDAGFRRSNKVGQITPFAYVVATRPVLDPDRVHRVLLGAGVSADRTDLVVRVLREIDPGLEALDALAGEKPGLASIDRLSDLAHDAGWGKREMEMIRSARHGWVHQTEHGWVATRRSGIGYVPEAQALVEVLVKGGCDETRANEVVMAAGSPWSLDRLPPDLVARYGPRRSEPVGTLTTATRTIRYLEAGGRVQVPDLDGFLAELAQGRVPVTLSWSEDNGLTWLSVEGTASVTGEVSLRDIHPPGFEPYLGQLSRVIACRPGDVVDLWAGLSSPSDLVLSRREEWTAGWIPLAAEILTLVGAGRRVPVALRRRLLAVLIREPSEVSTDQRLRDLLDLPAEHLRLLDHVATLDGSRSRLAEALETYRDFGLAKDFGDTLYQAAGRSYQYSSSLAVSDLDRGPDLVGRRRATARRLLAGAATGG